MLSSDSAAQPAAVQTQPERLDSWKQIAAYLGRDIRTVQRWEKLEGLPVHRHQHQKRASAFAYTAELDSWWHGRGKHLETEQSEAGHVLQTWLPRMKAALPWAITAFACTLLPVLLMLARSGANHEHPVQRLAMIAPLDTKIGVHPVISPEGKKVAFIGSDAAGVSHLFIRSFDAVDAQRVAGTDGAAWPFWSSDGRYIAFFAAGKLKRTDTEGQSPRIICDAPNGRGGTWTGNVIVFAPFISGALYEVPSSGGTPRAITVLDSTKHETSHRWPQFLPDGRRFIFFVLGGKDVNGMYIASLDSPSHTRLLSNDSSAVYADGSLFFWREGGLVTQRMETSTGRVTGEVFRMPDSPVYNETYGIGPFSASTTGALVYQHPGRDANRLVWFNRSGREVGVAGPVMTGVSWVALSPDEQQVAIQRFERDSENPAIWLGDLRRGGWSRFTYTQPGAWWPVWSPDGRRIAFASRHEHGLQAIYEKSTDTGEPVKSLVQWPTVLTPTDWSRDGRYLLFQSVGKRQNRRISVFPASGETDDVTFPESDFDEVAGHFSPDGRWVAYASNESDTFQIYVQPFPPNGRKQQVSTTGGYQPRWRKDGNELYYVTPDRQLMAVAVTPGNALRLGPPEPLFNLPIENPAPAFAPASYDVAADGESFLVSRVVSTNTDSITVVLNWAAALKR